jgi:hypothetical protein
VGNSGATEIGSGALQDDEASENQTDSRGKVFKVKSGIGVANSHGNGASLKIRVSVVRFRPPAPKKCLR